MKKKKKQTCVNSHDFLVGEFDGLFLIRSQWVRELTAGKAIKAYGRLLNPDPNNQLLILKVEESR